MSRYRYSIILLTFYYSFHIYFTKYSHHNFIGNIKNGNIKFSIHTLNFEGIVLFARDIENKLLIKFERTFDFGKIIIFYYNDDWANVTIENLCGSKDCDKKHLVFDLNLNMPFIVQCNNQTSLKLDFQKSIEKKSFSGYPEPAFNDNNSNNVFIWMGNIGLYHGRGNKEFYPCKDQLHGCLEYFSYNNNSLIINKTGNLFLSSCVSYEMTEYLNNRPEKKISANLFDCSLSLVSINYCKNDLTLYRGENQEFEYFNVHNKYQTQFTLKWKQYDLKNFCLIEIRNKNGSIILFTINKSFHIVKHIEVNNRHEEDTLNKIEDSKNLLIIDFQSSFYSVKIISGHEIYVHTYHDFVEPNLVNVGKSTFMNSCLQYEGAYAFQYNSSQFKRSQNKSTPTKNCSCVKKEAVYNMIFLSVGVVIIILLILNLISCKKRPTKSHSDSNLYENQFDLEGISTSFRLRNSDVYEIITERVQ